MNGFSGLIVPSMFGLALLAGGVAQASTVVLSADADLYTYKPSGGAAQTVISTNNRILVYGQGTNGYGYIQFTVTDGTTIDTDEIASAKLRIWLAGDTANPSGDITFTASVISNSADNWKESSFTAGTTKFTPAVGSESSSVTINDAQTRNGYVEWDVKSLLISENGINNNVIGFRITHSGLSSATVRFTDRDPSNDTGNAKSGYAPQLVIEVPEPASISLLCLGTLFLIGRPSRFQITY